MVSVTALVNCVLGVLVLRPFWQGVNHQDSVAVRAPPKRGRSPFVVVERGQLPSVVAHRGSSGTYPESTMKAFQDAIERGAAFLECDVQMTKDGNLVISHDPNLIYTTNVAEVAEFRGRNRTHFIDEKNETGWFTLDFTLDEVRRLRVRQRYKFRNHAYDNTMALVTVDELMDFVVASNEKARSKGMATVGVLIETKHPTWYLSQGYDITNSLMNTLEPYVLKVSISIESIEMWNLIDLSRRTPAVQLTALTADIPSARRPSKASPYYGSMFDRIDGKLTLIDVSISDIAEFAHAIGPEKTLLLNQTSMQPTNLVTVAHLLGLLVQTWTFSVEDLFVCPAFKAFSEEITFFARRVGADAIMSDYPDETVKALDEVYNVEF